MGEGGNSQLSTILCDDEHSLDGEHSWLHTEPLLMQACKAGESDCIIHTQLEVFRTTLVCGGNEGASEDDHWSERAKEGVEREGENKSRQK